MDLKMEWQGKRAFSGVTASGHELITDSSAEFGGENRAASPMEMLLGSVIGCTGIDIVAILEKMRFTPTDFQIETIGERAESHPKRFTVINLHYIINGDIPENNLRRAIELSLNKYCSVAYSLNAKLGASYSLNGGEDKVIEID